MCACAHLTTRGRGRKDGGRGVVVMATTHSKGDPRIFFLIIMDTIHSLFHFQ